MTHEEQRKWLIRNLLDENTAYKSWQIPDNEQEQKDLLRSLMNVRMPKAISNEFQNVQDAYLTEENAKAGIELRLRCNYVLHTVGPIVQGRLQKKHEILLASCYRSCLELAEDNQVESIVFCCISTGVFMFPNQRAAEIAVKTVREYQKETGSQILQSSGQIQIFKSARCHIKCPIIISIQCQISDIKCQISPGIRG